MTVSFYAHRQAHDTNYFSRGGVERRRGSWERRSGRDRRFSTGRRLEFDNKYIFVPERQSGQDRRRRVDLRIGERKSGIDRRETQIERWLLSDLSRLEQTPEKKSLER